MKNKSNTEVRSSAEKAFKKDQQARDGMKAAADYETASAAVRAKTARLKALRLDKEASDRAAAAAKQSAPDKRSARASHAKKLATDVMDREMEHKGVSDKVKDERKRRLMKVPGEPSPQPAPKAKK